MYGMLLECNKNRENKYLLQYHSNQEGILTWIAFEREYNHDGMGELKQYDLEEQIGKTYKENYPGGLHKYLDDYQVALAEYNVLAEEDAYSERKAKDKLLMNLVHATAIAHLVQVCRDKKEWTLGEAATYIKRNSHLVKDYNLTPSVRKKVRSHVPAPAPEPPASAMLKATTMVNDKQNSESQEDWLGEDQARTLLHTMAETTRYTHVFNVMQHRPFRDNMHIPTEIWRRLEPEFQTRIREIRGELSNRDKRTSNTTPSTCPPAPILPPQYPKTEPVRVTHVLGGQEHEEYLYDSDSTDDDACHRLTFHSTTRHESAKDTNTDLQVRAHLEYGQA